jgi:outer membrane lipoprotein-sorting protein
VKPSGAGFAAGNVPRRVLLQTFGAVFLGRSCDSLAQDDPLPPRISRVLDRYSRTSGLSARFSEEKRIAFLKGPLSSQGRIYVAASGSFARIVEAPDQSKVVVKDGYIEFREGDGPAQKIPLEKHKELRALVEGVLLIFTGNSQRILQLYEANSVLSGDTWTLDLRPRRPELRKLLERIVVRGDTENILGFEVVEQSGDRTSTMLLNVQLDRKFSADELRRIFSV